MMLNFLGLNFPKGQKEERRMMNGEVFKFKYPEVVDDHYIYRGEVENYDDLRHYGGTKPQISFNSALGTTWWPIQFYLFSSCLLK